MEELVMNVNINLTSLFTWLLSKLLSNSRCARIPSMVQIKKVLGIGFLQWFLKNSFQIKFSKTCSIKGYG